MLFKSRIQEGDELEEHEKGLMVRIFYENNTYIITDRYTASKINLRNIDKFYRELKNGKYKG